MREAPPRAAPPAYTFTRALALRVLELQLQLRALFDFDKLIT